MDLKINQKLLVGERALFKANNLKIMNSTFADGESPLKESKNITLNSCLFKWKYPLWYSKNITLSNCTLFEMARAGIWYTDNISLDNCIVEAPKNFRRCNNVNLNNVTFSNASETLWNCKNVSLKNVNAKGDYLAMNSEDIKIENFELIGNYCFDGAKNIEIHNARMISKDAFWNCDNVTVYDSFISGEYIGWNSKKLTFVNCTIESLQGFCYIENLVLKNCKLLNTNLTFEYSTVNAEVVSGIDSIKNPSSGKIVADNIGEIIFDDELVDKNNTKIILKSNFDEGK